MGKRMREAATVLFSEEQIRERVRVVGSEIAEAFSDEELCVVGLMKSCLVFMADLIRAVPLELTCHTLRVVQTGEDEASSRVEIVYATEVPFKGKNVLLLDDVIDTGITLRFLVDHVKDHEPKQLKICSLIDKPQERKVDLEPDWTLFTLSDPLDDRFIVGYGLDSAERYMGLPYLGTIPRDTNGGARRVMTDSAAANAGGSK
jgi:hypoxanthine phosphoribosyltransferase